MTSEADRTLPKLLVFPDARLQPLPEVLTVRPVIFIVIINCLFYLGKRFSSKRSQPKFGSVCAFRVPDPSQWLILSVAVAFLGVFSAFMLFVFYRCKATCHNRQLHYLKAQMNSIEMRAAQESKAFDELQTKYF